jgi:hypothetical protein
MIRVRKPPHYVKVARVGGKDIKVPFRHSSGGAKVKSLKISIKIVGVPTKV